MQRKTGRGAANALSRLSTCFILVLGLTLLPWLTSPLAAKTYRWVDKEGNVHYSDQIPPQDINQGYSVINQQGVEIKNVDKAKSQEELEEARRLQQQREEQQRLAREKAIYDHILLDTYTTVSDLEDTRDRHIATLEGQIKVSEHKLGNLNRELNKLTQSAANLERDGKAVPEDLSKDIASLQSQIDRENSFIRSQRTQQQEVREKFAADIARFKELKSGQQTRN